MYPLSFSSSGGAILLLVYLEGEVHVGSALVDGARRDDVDSYARIEGQQRVCTQGFVPVVHVHKLSWPVCCDLSTDGAPAELPCTTTVAFLSSRQSCPGCSRNLLLRLQIPETLESGAPIQREL